MLSLLVKYLVLLGGYCLPCSLCMAGALPSLETDCSYVLQVFGIAKMWEEALRVKSDMLEAGITPNVVTWTSIIGACANAGFVEQSFREFDEMLRAGCPPNVNCYNMLLQACVMVMLFTCMLASMIFSLASLHP